MSENFIQRAFAFVSIALVVVSIVLSIACFFANPALAAQNWFLEGGGFNWAKLLFFGGAISNPWIASLCWIGIAVLTFSIGYMFAPESMERYGARLSSGISRAMRAVGAAVKDVLSAAVSAIPWWLWAVGGVVLLYWLRGSGDDENNHAASVEVRVKQEEDAHELLEEG